MDSLIRWKKGDYIKLGQAVSRFNKIIGELDSNINRLPEEKILYSTIAPSGFLT